MVCGESGDFSLSVAVRCGPRAVRSVSGSGAARDAAAAQRSVRAVARGAPPDRGIRAIRGVAAAPATHHRSVPCKDGKNENGRCISKRRADVNSFQNLGREGSRWHVARCTI